MGMQKDGLEFVAIAGITDGKDIVEIRLYNINGGGISDLPYDWVMKVIQEAKVRNLRVKDDKIEWVHGCIERYPIINKLNDEVRNDKSITVIRYMYNRKGNIYRVVNYKGESTDISEEQIMLHDKKYGITNCRVVNTGGRHRYLASICEKLNKIGSDGVIYDELFNRVSMGTENVIKGKLLVPEKVCGRRITGEEEITIVPYEGKNRVKHIVFNKSIEEVGDNSIKNLTELEEITCEGDVVKIDLKENGYRIKTINIEGLQKLYSLNGTKNLEAINRRDIKFMVNRSLYANFRKLNQDNMIYEGIVVISQEAFRNCTQLEVVDLPKSLETMNVCAFSGCSNIKEVVINNSALKLEPSMNYRNDRELKFLEDSPNAIIKCPYDFPIEELKKLTSEHVKIVTYGKEGFNEKRAERRYKKAKLLGMNTMRFKIADTPEEVWTNIKLIPEQNWKKRVIEIIQKQLTVASKGQHAFVNGYTVGGDGAFINLRMEIEDGHVKEAKIGDKYAYLIMKNNIEIIAVDKDRIGNLLGKSIEEGKKLRYAIGYPRTGFILGLPHLMIGRGADDVEEIYEEGEELIVKLRDGTKEKHCLYR